jgi:uncharacterized phiE125 gp8 family phage protein
MALKLITAPQEEPISLAVAREHLKSDSTAEDALILGWIAAARQTVENYLNRALITQTWELSFDAFPHCSEIEIPLGRLQSVTSVKYLDASAAEQTFASAGYHADTRSEPGRIVLDRAYAWPATVERPNAVIIRFVCGYGLAAAVPQAIKAAMQLMINDFDQHRGEVIVGGTVQEIPNGAKALLMPYKFWSGL